MIHAEEALAVASSRRPAKKLTPALTEEELLAFGYIDYTIETGILQTFTGEPFEVRIPADVVRSVHVAEMIKAHYEAGEWAVGMFPISSEDGTELKGFQLVFTPKTIGNAQKREGSALPSVIVSNSNDTAMAGGTRILVRMPTRGRPAQAISVLSAYQSMAGMPIQMEVIVDNDDETVTSEVLYRFHALGCHIVFGDHENKVAACNDGRVSEWDVIVLGSDDMVPVKDGWAVRIVELFEEHFPFFDGCLHTDDGYAHDRVNTLSILGRRYYEMHHRRIYNPIYKSLFCDDEHTEIARKLGRIVYVPEVLIEHRHPAAGKAKLDELYAKNDALWKQDEAIYKMQLASGFGLSEMKLSLLICTYPDRRAMLERFLDYLYAQTSAWWTQNRVEIVVDAKPAASLGEKRQRLLDRAKGEYVAFVDDDDLVSPDYVARVVRAIGNKPDCVSLVGVMTTNGNRPEKFEHSLKYKEWRSVDGFHERTPNHLNVIRTEIARKIGFGNRTYTEDRLFSDELYPLLHNEESSGDAPLYHYFARTKPSMEGAVK